MPLYIVTNKETQADSLVKASNQAQALRHIASSVYEVKVAKASDVADLMGQGAPVQNANEEG